jgi:pyruvate/2-oxoglutarate dehydrogenase complex dihydrolipoamide dehydrogenase (E3) component
MLIQESYDFVVIGGGSAGYAAASTASELGLKTLCVEGGKEVGGLCILRGCMPSKTLLESANRFRTLRRAEEFGLTAGHIGFDSKAIIERKRRLIGEFAGYRVEQLESGRFEFARAHAELINSTHLKLQYLNGQETEVVAKTILIATGSVLNLIDIPGLKETGFIHSDIALDSEKIPGSVILLGGGAIALEFAHFYNALGVEVTVIQRSGQLIKEADRDVAEALAGALQKRGVNLFCGTKLLEVQRSEGGKQVRFEYAGKEMTVQAEEIFYALGRRPAVDRLNLESANVELTAGSIKVTGAMQTRQPNIFAAGDATGLFEVVHIAIEQAVTAVKNAANFLAEKPLLEMDDRLQMFAMFTEPEVAFVGLTEKSALKEGRSIRVAKYPFNDHGKSIVRGEPEGFVKLITDAGTGEILGGAVVGPEAAELIHEIVVAMYFRATAKQLASIPHYHPTLSEIWTYPAEELMSS